jgi:hypothetical protein
MLMTFFIHYHTNLSMNNWWFFNVPKLYINGIILYIILKLYSLLWSWHSSYWYGAIVSFFLLHNIP